MPTYDYDCPRCGGFSLLRRLAERNVPAACPDCGSDAARVLAAAPQLAAVGHDTRRAMEINERARHEPRSAGEYVRMRHPAGCGCCTPGRRGATVTAANGAKAFPTKRPWMISH